MTEAISHCKYRVVVDESRRITLQHHHFLQNISPDDSAKIYRVRQDEVKFLLLKMVAAVNEEVYIDTWDF